MFKTKKRLEDKTINKDVIQALINEADVVLIGAAAGMSVPAGINYFDTDFFSTHFKALTKKGLSYQYQLVGGGGNLTPEEGFAMVVRTYETQYRDLPAGQNYFDLKALLENKKHFVITTNVDSQFYKAGFEKGNVYTPQGAYHLLQCPIPCHDEVYPIAEFYDMIMDGFDEATFTVKSSHIPKCPKCGEPMRMNVRGGMFYVDRPYRDGRIAYERFIEESIGKKLLLLELGVGYNTPGIIRYPFEKMAELHPDALLIRLNLENPELENPENPNAYGFSVDLGTIFQ